VQSEYVIVQAHDQHLFPRLWIVHFPPRSAPQEGNERFSCAFDSFDSFDHDYNL
jgi:hypothetical protein